MKAIVKNTEKVFGEIEVPGDKSISHRSLILGSICRGVSNIDNFLHSEDCLSTLKSFKLLGVDISFSGATTLTIKGNGGGFAEPEDILDCGNSGTTMRLLAGLLSSRPFYSLLTGDNSLRKRPMRRIIVPLKLMGAEVFGRANNSYPPITVIGKNLSGIDYRLPVSSAQVKSCIILASIFSKGLTVIEEPLPSRDHTERMLKYLGGNIKRDSNKIYIEGGQRLTAKDIHIPGDFSSAAYFLAAAAITKKSRVAVRNLGLNSTRTGLLDIMKRMGADFKLHDCREISGEPFGTVEVRNSKSISGVNIGRKDIPAIIDEVPLIAVMACFADGRTLISGAEELRFKESDRLKAIATELRKMGACIEETQDGLSIEGGHRLKGTSVDSWSDHRIAMALAVAALNADGETSLENCECINISFPSFFDLLRAAGADVAVDSASCNS